MTVSDACGSAKAHKHRNCSTFAYKVRAFVHTAACCYGIKRLATAKAWCIIKDIDRCIHTSLPSTVRQKLSHQTNTHCSQEPAHALNRSNDRQNNRKQSTSNLLSTYISIWNKTCCCYSSRTSTEPASNNNNTIPHAQHMSKASMPWWLSMSVLFELQESVSWSQGRLQIIIWLESPSRRAEFVF